MGSSENSLVAFHEKVAAAWSANDGTESAAARHRPGVRSR
jgi:hypothetical protein